MYFQPLIIEEKIHTKDVSGFAQSLENLENGLFLEKVRETWKNQGI